MATDIETLLVKLEAKVSNYERDMAKARQQTDRMLSAVEARTKGFENAVKRSMENASKSMAKAFDGLPTSARSISALTAAFGAVGVGLSTREVLQYADAWKSAQNALSVAGVTGQAQTQVLDSLYQSAQANAAPVGSLVQLYGRAAQASKELGANQGDLLKFTDGVATALKVNGTSATEASGALLQLSQLLSSGTVHAEEFNSVNEGARPILQAVANGMDGVGGSVAKLRAQVIAGNVSSRQFFEAFLKGLPSIQQQAASASQTIEQGFTKIQNAFTRYIGQTDSSLGATARLSQGLNFLADNFDKTADVTLKFAAVIAGALVGRSIAGMLTSLGAASVALTRFMTAMTAARSVGGLAAAFGGIGAAAGPIGALVGVAAAGAMVYFTSTTAEASQAARDYASALKQVQEEGNKTPKAVTGAADRISESEVNRVKGGVEEARKEIAKAREELAAMLEYFASANAISTDPINGELRELAESIRKGGTTADEAKEKLAGMANADPEFQPVYDKLADLITNLRNAMGVMGLFTQQLNSLGGGGPGSGITGGERLAGNDRALAGFQNSERAKNALSQKELTTQKYMKEVQKDLNDLGVQATSEKVRQLALDRQAADERRKDEGKKARSSGGGGRTRLSAEDKFDINAGSYERETAAIRAQIDLIGKSTFEREKAAQYAELEAQALERLRRAKGVDAQLSAEQKAKLEELATGRAAATAGLEEARKKYEELQDAQREFGELAFDGLYSLIDGSKDLKGALEDTLKTLAKLVLQAALLGQGPLAGLFGGSSNSGGLLGGLFSGFTGLFASSGGYISGPGTGRSDSIPAMLSNGEYVVNAGATKQHRSMLEAMNSGRLPGFASGGFVGIPAMPQMPSLAQIGRAAGGSNGPVSMTLNVDARGTTQESLPILMAELKRLEHRVPAIVLNARKRGVL